MNSEKIKRYGIFAAGVVFTSLGIALITQAGRGTSAVASPAYVLSSILPYSMGTFTVVVNLFMIAIQIVLLGRAFSLFQLLQLPVSVIFGTLIDWFRYLLSDGAGSAIISWVYLGIGSILLGVGVGLQQSGDVMMLPAEGAVRAIALTGKWEFGNVKVWFDVLLVSVSAVISYLFHGYVVGIREGTLIVALTTGPISRIVVSCHRRFFQRFSDREKQKSE